jgi:hypothetical protein
VPSIALAIGYFDNFIKPFSETQTKDYKLTILIPKDISDIHNQIDLYFKTSKSKHQRRFLKKQRPVVFKYPTKEFWDIPTTLTTLNSVITHFVLQEEIGANDENNEWIQHEIRNFVGALKHLISQNCKCKKNVVVKYIED